MKPYPHKRFSFAFMFLLAAVFCLSFPHPALAAPSDVVISQVFGGGGNSQAPYKNDFVELFNRSTTAVTLDGWSLQYASATGTGNFSANPIVTLSGSLQPGQYYLIQLAGGANGTALPAPDKIGAINMAAGAGKIALVHTTTGLTCNGGSTPCQPSQLTQLVDLVGWGNANFYEGGPAPATSNTLALFRNNNGCQDSDNNTI
ncbi:MAG: lamin tail domain-containing protein, partial [Desulfobacteraceae bacterium]